MGQYKSQYTGPQIDAGVDAALNPDVTVTPDSDALVTSGAVADALDNIDPTITGNTDTTLNGILVGNGSKVGTKSLDTSSLTNDGDHVPVSSVVKSAITHDLANIVATGTTNTTGAVIVSGTYFYLDGTLVRAKTNIAVNATFTSGTNYEAVTAGGLNDLQNIETIAVSYSSYLNWNDENCWVRRQGAVVNFSVQCSLNNGPIPAGTEIISGLPISNYDLIFNVIGAITDTPNPTFSVFYVWHGSVYTREAIPTTGNAYLYLQFCYICAK